MRCFTGMTDSRTSASTTPARPLSLHFPLGIRSRHWAHIYFHQRRPDFDAMRATYSRWTTGDCAPSNTHCRTACNISKNTRISDISKLFTNLWPILRARVPILKSLSLEDLLTPWAALARSGGLGLMFRSGQGGGWILNVVGLPGSKGFAGSGWA